MTDFLMEKEVLVGKYRGLQLPDKGGGFEGDGDGDNEDDDDDDVLMVMQIMMKTRKHLVIEGKRKGEMDSEDRATVALQWLTCDLLLCWRFDENLQW